MSFYHNVKEHMSPSAIAQWNNGRGAFIKTYFQGEKFEGNSATEAGTKIHRLIEAGMIEAQISCKNSEKELRVQVPGSDFFFMGRPDGYESRGPKLAVFVDYKTGKANSWTEKLPTDLKMRATAWLVWIACDRPDAVEGSIEFIQTTWDPERKEIVPIDGKEAEIVTQLYTADELNAFTRVIIETMEEVNEFFERWKESTGEFVNKSDLARYVELKKEIEERELELDEVGRRIMGQMEFGGEENHRIEAGTFILSERSTYEYPADLPVHVGEGITMTLTETDKVVAGVKAAKKNYELIAEPKSVSRTISFRPSRK